MFFGNTMSVQVFQQTALHKYTCPQFRGFQLQTQTRMQTMYQIILMKFCDSSKVKANVLKPMYLISIFKALVHTVLHRAGTLHRCAMQCASMHCRHGTTGCMQLLGFSVHNTMLVFLQILIGQFSQKQAKLDLVKIKDPDFSFWTLIFLDSIAQDLYYIKKPRIICQFSKMNALVTATQFVEPY